MDFQEYVAARRTSLVRAAVLLGAAEVAAPRAVRDVLLSEAARIERRADPDPLVLAALVERVRHEAARLPVGDEPGLVVRRRLAAMDPDRRAVAVLAFHADLTPHEIAAALDLEVDEVATAEVAARADLGVPDRTSARELVGLAGDTISPPPGDAIVRPDRDARWVVVAAAAVAVVALTAAAVAARGGVEPVLDDDQVPSLFGYDAAAARTLLTDRGLRVEQRPIRACEVVETVVNTDPPTGTRFADGDTVTIWTAVPSDAFCMARYPARLDGWKFLRWAADRGPAPVFADGRRGRRRRQRAGPAERVGGDRPRALGRPRGPDRPAPGHGRRLRRTRHDRVPDAGARRVAARPAADELRRGTASSHRRPAGRVRDGVAA